MERRAEWIMELVGQNIDTHRFSSNLSDRMKARPNVAHELKKLSDKYSRKKTEIDKQIERMK